MKKFMLICAPVSSRSGYGAHARDLVTSLISHDKYTIKIQDVPWGACPRNALSVTNENDKKIIDCILKPTEQVNQQPDIYIDIRIPNEFQTYGKFNIGITAGIETNAVSQNWLQACNKMDLTIVPSEHSKQGFVNSVWDKLQQLPDGQQQKVGEVRLEKPMEILFEGADEDIYKPIENASLNLVDDIKEDFCFLHVGQWTKGGYGEDRKDIGKMIKVFFESFANKKEQPALILKTNGATYSILDKEECIEKIKNIKNMFPSEIKLPNVYLLHGSLSDDEMNKLYNHPKVKSFLSFTHGEGFGRPLLEASMVGLPIVASNWSGHTDFLSGEQTSLIGGKMVQVPKSQAWKDIILEQSSWFDINENDARKVVQDLYKNYKSYKSKAEAQMEINRKKFTLNKMTEEFDKIMEKYVSELPTQVGIKLPKLKKVEGKKELPKMKLPKLKKLTTETSV